MTPAGFCRRGLALCVAAALFSGCSEHPATEVIVQLYVDAKLAPSAATLHVTVENDEGKAVLDRDKALSGVEGRIARIPLIPQDGDPSRRFVVKAELRAADKSELARLEAHAGYTENELRSLNLLFSNSCSTPCEPGRTCVGSVCKGSCFDTAPAESTTPALPLCGECERCAQRCEPADAAPCGCPGESCLARECVIKNPVSLVAAGFLHTCAALLSTDVYCWGQSGFAGRLGQGAADVDSAAPLLVANVTADQALAVSGNRTMALTYATRYAWGENDTGQLGAGSVTPVELAPLPIANSEQLTELSAGFEHTCGSFQSKIWCWGRNQYGEVGIGTLTPAEPTPMPIGEGYDSFSAGGEHTCAVKTNHALQCWGRNQSLQIGAPVGESVPSPVRPGCEPSNTGQACFDDWIRVASGGFHTCAIRQNGNMYCWGAPQHGQLGIGPGPGSEELVEPHQVQSTLKWSYVAAGTHFTCGLDRNSALYCWGRNDDRQTGIPDADVVWNPTRVSAEAPGGWKRLSLGDRHACGVRVDGALFCWGRNAEGQIGIGVSSEEPITQPKRVCF